MVEFLGILCNKIHWSQKILARSHFFHLSFHRFFQFSQKAHRITKYFIYHMKDLKSGYLISLKQKAWLPLKGSHALGNETRTILTKINFLAFGAKLLLISNTESICLFQGFQKRYITFPQIQGLKRYEVSKFEKLKSCQIYLVKRTFFSELELCRLVSFQSLGLGKGYIPLLKALKQTN